MPSAQDLGLEPSAQEDWMSNNYLRNPASASETIETGPLSETFRSR